MVAWARKLRNLFKPRETQRAELLSAWDRHYQNRLQARYDAAKTTFENEKHWAGTDWLSPIASASHSVRKMIRERARYEILQNNSYGNGIMQSKRNDVVGVGPTLQVTTDNREFNAAVEQRWNEWAQQVCFAQKLRTAYQAKIVDGETFIEQSNNPQLPTAVKLDLRVYETDMFTARSHASVTATQRTVDGIHYDEYANPVMYERLSIHPGESWPIDGSNGFTRGLMLSDYEPVPAEQIIHWFRVDRPDQRRGISEFAPALPLFAELRRYTLAVIAAAEAAADFAIILQTNSAVFKDEAIAFKTLDDWAKTDIERRMMTAIPQGWTAEQMRPEQPTTQYGDFEESIVKQISRTLGVPLNIAQGSSRNHNFASARLDYLLYWNACDVERSEMQTKVLEPIWMWWLDEATLIPGYLPSFRGLAVDIPHRWYFPQRRPIDEVKSAQAEEIMWNLGLRTDEDYFAATQTDPDRHYERLARQYQRREAIGAPLPGGNSPMNEEQAEDEDVAVAV